ncbi:MAG: N(4)-(beta-N-acetylglucosaminyl)-L-asparaginase [Candidatus Bathyarchaeia archaeon]
MDFRSEMKQVMVATWGFGFKAVAKGLAILKSEGSALDAVEEGIKVVEDDLEVLTVGLGGLPNFKGEVELDASIMDGETLRSGAVGALKYIRHPISVARKVMELTPHILLVGEGALEFALKCGFKREFFWKPDAREKWVEMLEKIKRETLEEGSFYGRIFRVMRDFWRETVSVIALDARCSMAAGNSTTGLFMKMPGRVGDSAIIGAGIYVDNRTGGAVTTGVGEIAVNYCLSKRVCDLMSVGLNPHEACEKAIRETLYRRNFVNGIAVLALNNKGEVGAATSLKEFTYAYQDDGMGRPELKKVGGILT